MPQQNYFNDELIKKYAEIMSITESYDVINVRNIKFNNEDECYTFEIIAKPYSGYMNEIIIDSIIKLKELEKFKKIMTSWIK